MKKLVLDYSKWRCGGESNNQVGKGATLLLNNEGFMCCLGQFSLQLNPNLTESDLINEGEPETLPEEVSYLNYASDGDDEYPSYRSTELSRNAISVNDNWETTSDEKIALLQELFGKEGFEIEVINKP